MPRRVVDAPLPLLPPAPPGTERRGAVVADPVELGALVRRSRTVRRRTLPDFAALTGHSVSAVQKFETGSARTSLAVAMALLADAGFDLVVVPRDPRESLQEVAPVPARTSPSSDDP
jgi:hypothetical protein